MTREAAPCAHKKKYDRYSDAYRTYVKMQPDPYLDLYVCLEHNCLHLGHRTLGREYATWRDALQAVRHIQWSMKNPKKCRIRYKSNKWLVTWSKK